MNVVLVIILGLLSLFPGKLYSQNIYELRKYTEEDWLSLSTDGRLRALGTGLKHAQNQAFLGDFGRYYELYKKWGYEFYKMEDRYENYGFRGFESYYLNK